MQPYAEGILSPSDREAFEAHLAECPGCSLELDLIRSGVQGAAEQGAGDSVAAPVGAEDAPKAGACERAPSAFVRSGDAGFQPQNSPPPPADESSFSDVLSEFQLAEAPVKGAGGDTPPASPPSLDDLLASVTPPPPPEPAAERPGEPPAATAAAATASGANKDWSFEPADAGTRTAPPPGSLFLAEEALNDGGPGARARRKTSRLRSVAWIAGGGVGLALLGVAGWLIWSSRPELEEPARLVARPTAGDTARSATTVPGPSSTAAPSAPAVEASPAAPPTGEPEAPRPSAAATLTPSSATPAGMAGLAATPASGQPIAPAAPQKPIRSTERRASARAQGAAGSPPPGTRAVLSPADSKPAGGAGTTASASTPREAKPAVPAAPVAQAPPVVEAPPADEAGLEPPPAAAGPAVPEVVKEPAATATTGDGDGPRAPEAPAPAPAPRAEATARPIDRIHLATVAAEERGDLSALRSLRATWRSMVQRSGVGPDRTRAKRELADCLWAIQSLTARKSDQRDALTAYRDYIINAPAGGADSRSIARIQLLQDALSESH
jgi:hypothetical protein